MPTVASFCLIISADIFSFYLLSLFVLPAVLVSLVAALPFAAPRPWAQGTRDQGHQTMFCCAGSFV